MDATRTTRLRVQLNRKPAYAVAGAELARFYLASLGMVAHRLLVADLDLDGAIATLVDPERTGRIDDRTFQIAPLSPLSDTGAAMQLAMILASPDLLQFWRELSANVRQDKMSGGVGVLDAPAPAATKHVIAHAMPYTLALPDRDIRALRVTRIEADMRPPPFATLIVHSPISYDDQDEHSREDENGDRRDDEDRRRRRLGDSLKLNRNERPGRSFVKLAALGQSFTSAFPRFKEVAVRHVGGVPRPLGTPRKTETKAEEFNEVSTLTPGGDPDIAALVAQPNPPVRPRPPVPAEVRGNLLDDLPREPMRRFDVPVDGLPYPLELFAKAVLRTNGGGYIVPDDAEFPLFEMNPEWGVFAMLRAERPRLAAIGWLDLEGARVCAIDMERRYPKEALATGLFLRADGGALSLAEAAAVLRYTCHRQEIDEGLTWRLWPPDGLFADLRATSVTHHGSRRSHISMSEELERRASLLAGERASFLAA